MPGSSCRGIHSIRKGAKLIRLDDWYVHEVRERKKDESGYWITTDVRTDKDGDTIIVVYVGHKDSNEKAQFFIKPENIKTESPAPKPK